MGVLSLGLGPDPSARLYLWDKRTLYLGGIPEPIKLAQGAATLVVAIDGELKISIPRSKVLVCKSALIPAGYTVSIDTNGAMVANCNLDAVGGDFFALQSIMQDRHAQVLFHHRDEQMLIHAFKAMMEQPPRSEQAYVVLESLLIPVELKALNYEVDERIQTVIDYIKSSINEPLSVQDLAQVARLSVPRLAQLFKKQTGVPIRRYRLWHRLYLTAFKMGQGCSLTDAALAAGFSDSSHCTRTFRSMLGFKPSLILGPSQGLEIITPDSL